MHSHEHSFLFPTIIYDKTIDSRHRTTSYKGPQMTSVKPLKTGKPTVLYLYEKRETRYIYEPHHQTATAQHQILDLGSINKCSCLKRFKRGTKDTKGTVKFINLKQRHG